MDVEQQGGYFGSHIEPWFSSLARSKCPALALDQSTTEDLTVSDFAPQKEVVSMQYRRDREFHIDRLFSLCFRMLAGNERGAGGDSHESLESQCLVTTHALQDEHANSSHKAVIPAIPDGQITATLGELLQVVPKNVAIPHGKADHVCSIVDRSGEISIVSTAADQRV